ncbi:MAG: DUF368 domain-containing protein [Acidobacteriota bacterium]|nr:DUF368 domain-containing protein [Acidobacteriota bacterium]
MAGSPRISPRSWAPRAVAGGVLMGLANLVPGVSGGTMLLAVGIYPRFIEAVADTTRLRLRLQPLLLLVTVAAGGGLAILLLAGVLRDLVVHQRLVMYSVFIGLTLGGAPLVWRLARPLDRPFWGGTAGGFAAMAGLALLQSGPAGEGLFASGPLPLAVAGAAGAAAMILPGLSGAYLLLVLGQYEAILGAVDLLFQGIRGLDAADLLEAGAVLLPVLIGIALGATVISNAVRFALRRFRQATLGVLLGLLLGAVVGLWPFEASPPGALQLGSAVVLAAAGFVLTWGVGRLGRVPNETAT